MFQPLIDYDHDLEAAVLGVLLFEAPAYGKVYGMLVPECFYNQDHGKVFEAISSLYTDGYPIDVFMVGRWLYERNILAFGAWTVPAFLARCINYATTGAHIETWCLKLRELAVQRTALTITTSGIDRSEDVLDMAELISEKLRALTDIKARDDWEDGSKVALKLMQHMDDMQAGKVVGVSTGIRQLDELNGHFRGGQFILVGARPAVGKSALMGRMAVVNGLAGKTCGVITLEMDSKDVLGRMVAYQNDIDFYQIDQNKFYSDEERRHAIEAIGKTAQLPVFFSDTAQVSMRDIRAKAEKLMRKHGLDALYIDYLQLVVPDSNKQMIREQEVAKISIGTKRLARELGIPIIMLVQLNRQADGEEPKLTHLRESGSLEQDADVVLMLHREADSDDPFVKSAASLFVRKWRNGSEVRIPLHFDGPRMKFMEMSEYDPFANKNNPAAPFDDPRAGMKPPPVDFTTPRSQLFIEEGAGKEDVPF